MNLSCLTLTGFMSHPSTVLDFLPKGLMTVTGPNGGGKSSLPEAVSYCFWGKTLRGTPPWQEETACTVRVTNEAITVERSRTKGKTRLEWAMADGEEPPEYETATKAQEALEHIVGSWDVWRRSSVFSSHDATHFSLATDGERKRLIEAILGLDRFDPALESCRVDLKDALTALERMRADVVTKTASLESERRRLQEAKHGLALAEPPPAPPVTPGKSLKDLDGQLAAADRELASARDTLRRHDRVGVQQPPCHL